MKSRDIEAFAGATCVKILRQVRRVLQSPSGASPLTRAEAAGSLMAVEQWLVARELSREGRGEGVG